MPDQRPFLGGGVSECPTHKNCRKTRESGFPKGVWPGFTCALAMMAELGSNPEEFCVYEEGYPDVDLTCGVMPLDGLQEVSEVFFVSGHRIRCNMQNVQDRMQLTGSPYAIYLMEQFDNHDAMTSYRRKVVDAFRNAGYDVEPYVGTKETASRPQTVIKGTRPIPAQDIRLILDELDIKHVS